MLGSEAGSSARTINTEFKSNVQYRIRPCIKTKQNTKIQVGSTKRLKKSTQCVRTLFKNLIERKKKCV